jgi:dihydropteroate synthase
VQPGFVAPRPVFELSVHGRPWRLGERTLVMGVLNVTPDSFSDGGRFASPDAALAHGLALFESGADVVDVGGESTRPGTTERVPVEEELRRVVPVVAHLRAAGAGLLSVDTSRAEVARAALDAGADLVNDVSGLAFDPAMAPLLAERGVPAVLMHLRGDFAGMHGAPAYGDLMGEVAAELQAAMARAQAAGVRRSQLILDPGLGFSKDAGQTFEALRRLPELAGLGRPVLVGPSRKSFIGQLLGGAPGERLMGTAAAVAAGVFAGAHIVRVHDVHDMVQVARVCDALRGAPGGTAC